MYFHFFRCVLEWNYQEKGENVEQFIKNFGVKNFMIIFAIIIVILIALIVLFLIEKYSSKNVISNANYDDEDDEETLEDDEEEIISKKEPIINAVKEEKVFEPIVTEKQNQSVAVKKSVVYYAPEKPSEDEIKQKLDVVTKNLVKEEHEYGKTQFEVQQEEKSIISYEELKKVSQNIDEINDNLLLDEGNEPITLEELYDMQSDEIEELDELTAKLKDFQDAKKFRNSQVISPVFGVYGQQRKVKQSEEELEKTVELYELEDEIRKTEEFLRELKKLKNKL